MSKQLTDEDIVKALEIHKNCINCSECVYIADQECSKVMLQNAINLINRQKAEIDRYKCVIKILENDVKAAKSEAYKEFAERFIKEAHAETKALGSCHYAKTYKMSAKVFDALVKEMVGEE